MKAKLIKVALHDGYRLDDENGLYIASTLESSKSKLSLKNCQAIELGFDLDELSRKEILYNDQKREWWIQGAKAILEILGDKKFTEEDIIKAFNIGVEMLDSPRKYNDVLEELKKSLKQTEWDVTVEMEFLEEEQTGTHLVWGRTIPKLDTNGCLILKLSKND